MMERTIGVLLNPEDLQEPFTPKDWLKECSVIRIEMNEGAEAAGKEKGTEFISASKQELYSHICILKELLEEIFEEEANE